MGQRRYYRSWKNVKRQNPKNTDWERDIPEKCRDANKILTTADYSNFCSLQQLRHLCAHPVINENKELYRPNSDIVLGHIRNMLDGVLTKPAFRIKELFYMLLDDIANMKNILVDEKQLAQYVVSKYLDKFNDIKLEQHIFKALWKFVFYLDDENCKNNRIANYIVLKIIVRRHKDRILDFVSKNQTYFSKYIDCSNGKILEMFIKLLNEHTEFYNVLSEPKQIELNGAIDSDSVYELSALAIFRYQDKVRHIMDNTLRCQHSSLLYFADYLEKNAGHAVVLKYYVRLYEHSGNYDKADRRFNDFIEPYILDFSESQILQLIEATEQNGQINGRRNAWHSNEVIKNRMLEFDANFDFSKYPHFK